MIFDKNNLDIPTHLNETFFMKTLKNALNKNDIKIDFIKFDIGSGKGDNYLSQIYRISIKYNNNNNSNNNSNLSLIIKCIPINQANEFLINLNVFEKEKIVYFNIIPKIEKLVNCSYLAAKCFYSVDEPINTLVFEDLCKSDFRIAERQTGLDEKHCHLILTKLAKYHAGSMVLAKMNPDIMKNFNEGLFTKSIIDHSAYKNFFFDNFEYFTNNIVSNWNGYESISKKMKIISNNIKENILNISKSKPNEIKVLNHGDAWVNNFLFKYDNNYNNSDPIDCVFVDFQMSFYASLGIDINYFLNTSVNLDVYMNKRDQLIQHYYKILAKTLNDLKYDNIPTFDDIKNEIYNKELYGVITSIGLLPVISMDKELSSDNSLEAFDNENFAEMKRKLMYTTKRCIEHFKYALKRFNDIGILDM